MSILQIVNGLRSSVTSGQNPFLTYGEFARTALPSDRYPPSWAVLLMAATGPARIHNMRRLFAVGATGIAGRHLRRAGASKPDGQTLSFLTRPPAPPTSWLACWRNRLAGPAARQSSSKTDPEAERRLRRKQSRAPRRMETRSFSSRPIRHHASSAEAELRSTDQLRTDVPARQFSDSYRRQSQVALPDARRSARRRAKPGELTMGGTGIFQVPIEQLKRAAKANLIYVPYAGNAPASNAVLGGHITSLFAVYPTVARWCSRASCGRSPRPRGKGLRRCRTCRPGHRIRVRRLRGGKLRRAALRPQRRRTRRFHRSSASSPGPFRHPRSPQSLRRRIPMRFMSAAPILPGSFAAIRRDRTYHPRRRPQGPIAGRLSCDASAPSIIYLWRGMGMPRLIAQSSS